MAITAEDILKLSTPKKLGILGGLIVLIIAVFIWLLILPEYRKLAQKDQEYNKLQLSLNEKKKVTQDLKKFQARLENVRRELEVMKAQLPDKKEIE